MVLEGPLIYHLEVSKQGLILAVLPFGKIQTRFCISWPTIQNHLGNQHCTQLFHHSKPQYSIVNGFKWCINLYEKGTKSRTVKGAISSRSTGHRIVSLNHPHIKSCRPCAIDILPRNRCSDPKVITHNALFCINGMNSLYTDWLLLWEMSGKSSLFLGPSFSKNRFSKRQLRSYSSTCIFSVHPMKTRTR